MVSILFKWSLFLSLVNIPVFSNIMPGKAASHPIFMSVTEIEHNAKDKTLEISCKIFTDDFEKTLRQVYKTTVDLINPKDKAAMSKLVSDYVQKHLTLTVDGKKVALQFIGYEQQEEGILSYYQVNNITAVKKIDITNSILYEYKKEQIEIMHVTVGGNRKSTKLINPDDKASFEF
ncbi:DUF6702 family protein [Ferruginibacter sp. SUN106]|uniref:DUF6702 family protein n=1 Tax=Ferruginibacter sp. SUN106 TaxID=2978348 RepID=UPI003D36D22C